MELRQVKDESRVDEILKSLSFLNDKEIEIGIFEDGFKNGNELTVYGKAVINEYGAEIEVTDKMRAYLHHQGVHLKKDTTHITIPERSFIRSSFDKNENKINNTVEEMLDDVISGSLSAMDMVGIIGENCVRMIREYIQSVIPPENSPLTLSNKKGRTPLIDSGQMLKALDWRVVDK